jgi:hypothetical protein
MSSREIKQVNSCEVLFERTDAELIVDARTEH